MLGNGSTILLLSCYCRVLVSLLRGELGLGFVVAMGSGFVVAMGSFTVPLASCSSSIILFSVRSHLPVDFS